MEGSSSPWTSLQTPRPYKFTTRGVAYLQQGIYFVHKKLFEVKIFILYLAYFILLSYIIYKSQI